MENSASEPTLEGSSEGDSPSPAAPLAGASLSPAELAPLLEAILFVAEEPVSIERLSTILAIDLPAVEQGLVLLREHLEAGGLRLQRKGERVQLVTAPQSAGAIERFLGQDTAGKLSQAALETLAILAYRQPVTRVEIDALRGVQSDSVMRSLLSKGLVEEVGRLEQAGRPIIYGTTFEFLQHFGLQDLSGLPPLELDVPLPGPGVASAGEADKG